MPDVLVDLLSAFGAALLGGIVFAAIGLIAGTSESATIAPATLLIVLLGFPPAACYTFCIAAIVSKHIIHAAPTALLGIPGDTMAVPMLEPCAVLRRLGVPHVALQKMISAGVIASIVTIPIAVAFASVLAPLGDTVKAWAGAIFTAVALAIAYTSKGRWASVCMVVPLALVMQALDRTALAATGNRLVICFSLGIAIGPMFGDLLSALSPVSRDSLKKSGPTVLWLAPEIRNWTSIVPNPFKILTRRQTVYTLIASSASALTFTFSPVGMTIMVGEIIQSRLKSLYKTHDRGRGDERHDRSDISRRGHHPARRVRNPIESDGDGHRVSAVQCTAGVHDPAGPQSAHDDDVAGVLRIWPDGGAGGVRDLVSAGDELLASRRRVDDEAHQPGGDPDDVLGADCWTCRFTKADGSA